MQFRQLGLGDLTEVSLTERHDERGFFARLFCSQEFQDNHLHTHWAQINNSLTKLKGTVRGLHFQRPPSAEVKLVRCVRGSIFDVAVDLREGSATYGQWRGVELSAVNRNMLYIPAGFAHGFQSLANDSEIIYFNSTPYSPSVEGGLHCADRDVAISWPLPVQGLSERDQSLPYLADLTPIKLDVN